MQKQFIHQYTYNPELHRIVEQESPGKKRRKKSFNRMVVNALFRKKVLKEQKKK